jgi:hypothetical protein
MTSTTSHVETGVSLTFTVVQSGDGTTTLATDTLALATLTLSQDAASQDQQGAAFSADVFAAGEDTLATLAAAIQVEDGGMVATVSASIDAAAIAQGGETSIATATGDLLLLGPFDRVVQIAIITTSLQDAPGATTATGSVSNSLWAMNLDEGVIQSNDETAQQSAGAADSGLSSTAGTSFDIEGNVAIFQIDLAALGGDTATTVDVVAFTVEDLVSLIAASGIVIA